MSYEQESRSRYHEDHGYDHEGREEYDDADGLDHRNSRRYHDEIYSKRVPAGKRTYFFDVKTTRSGEDFFVTITESKRIDEGRYEKHKIFLYKEDFGKFLSAIHEVVQHIKERCLPDYDFQDLPEVTNLPDDEELLHAYPDDPSDS